MFGGIEGGVFVQYREAIPDGNGGELPAGLYAWVDHEPEGDSAFLGISEKAGLAKDEVDTTTDDLRIVLKRLAERF